MSNDVLGVMELHARGLRTLGYPSAADELFKACAKVRNLLGAAKNGLQFIADENANARLFEAISKAMVAP